MFINNIIIGPPNNFKTWVLDWQPCFEFFEKKFLFCFQKSLNGFGKQKLNLTEYGWSYNEQYILTLKLHSKLFNLRNDSSFLKNSTHLSPKSCPRCGEQ